MLRQSGALTHRGDDAIERLMDSGDLEKEKASRSWPRTRLHRRHPDGSMTVINVIDTPDTPTSAVRWNAGCPWSTGAVAGRRLRGPAAANPVRAAQGLAAHLPVILVVNKTDWPGRADRRVVSDSHDLLLDVASDLDEEAQKAAEDALRLPRCTPQAAGVASTTEPANGENPDGANLDPLFDVLLEHILPPQGDPDGAAAGPGDQPGRLGVPGPAGADPHLQGPHPQGSAGGLDA